MIVMHKKTGDLYQLIDDECKAKINGKWVGAVIYRGKDEETDRTKCFVREKSDFDSHFTYAGGIEQSSECLWLVDRIYILKEVATEYPGKTIENIIAQMEARRKEIGNSATK